MKPRGSEPKRGWPSKKVMADRSGGVFSLDFLFIEHCDAAEHAKRTSRGFPLCRWRARSSQSLGCLKSMILLKTQYLFLAHILSMGIQLRRKTNERSVKYGI
jgi:hypothetical protein